MLVRLAVLLMLITIGVQAADPAYARVLREARFARSSSSTASSATAI